MEELNEATRRFIEAHRRDDIARLALQLTGRTDIDARLALTQIEGWQRLQAKVPSWATQPDLRYPPRLSLEQCSGEAAARYKVRLVQRLVSHRDGMADLTGGLGVDFAFLAPLFRRAVYVERQAVLCRLARHNLPLVGAPHAEVKEADAVAALDSLPPLDLLFIDPARRDAAGRKTVCLADCEPDLERLALRLLDRADTVLAKLSPMLDLSEALSTLPHVAEAHVVAEGGECKELLVVMQRTAGGEPLIVCADGRLGFHPSEEAGALPHYATQPHRYLYEPEASVLKAGAFRLTAARYGLEKLHPNSHLYTADRLVTDFPGRTFEVTACSGMGRAQLRTLLGEKPKANLSVRNFPATVAELRKRLKLHDGGDTYLFATTLADGAHVLLVCRKVSAAGPK